MRTTLCLLLLAAPVLGQRTGSVPAAPPLPEPQIAALAPLAVPVARPPAAPWPQTAPNSDYVPLTNRQKLNVFVQRTYSPLTFLSTAFDASIAQAAADHPAYGGGGQGFGKRYGAAFADNESGVFFQAYLLPTMFHQDPRYYRRPELPWLRRAAYAASRTVLTRSDRGSTVFNVSYMAGGLIATGIANTYYPFNERGIDDTMVRWAGGIGSDAGLLVLHEFWPEIRDRLTATRAFRWLSGTKVGQKVERTVEGMDQIPQGEQPAKTPKK